MTDPAPLSASQPPSGNAATADAARAIAMQHWQRLIDGACRDGQVSPASVLRTEGVLQMALELHAVDGALLLRWGEQATQRLAAALYNPLWPDSLIRVDAAEVRIVMLHKRAPVHRGQITF